MSVNDVNVEGDISKVSVYGKEALLSRTHLPYLYHPQH